MAEQTLFAIAELKASKVGSGDTAVTREMIGAAHDVMLAKGDFVLSATCEALARTVMMDQTGAALEDAAENCLSALAGVETHDANLSDHPEAWLAIEAFAAKVRAAERDRWRNLLTEKANSKRKCYTQTQDGDHLAAAEALDWAVRELAPNTEGHRP